MEFLRIPTIGVLSAHRDDVRSRRRVAGPTHASTSASSTSRSPRRGGHPVVYADWLHAAEAPTVIVYAHYDVQPVDPLDEWVRPPFEPRVEDGRIYARGAADDKGQVHLHLWAARAWLETTGRLPLNVRYVFEGEEEAGSPNFEAWLVANRAAPRRGPRGRHRHGLLRGQPAGRHGRPARQHVPAGRRHGSQPGPPFGQPSAASSRTRPTPSCASSPRCATARAASRCPASTTTSAT